MLKKRNQGSTQTNNLVRSDIHKFYFTFIKNREVTSFTANDPVFGEVSFLIQWRICLCDLGCIFFFSTQESQLLHVHLAIINLAVRSFNEAHLVDLRVNAKCRDQT